MTQYLGAAASLAVPAGTASTANLATDDLGPAGFQVGKVLVSERGGQLNRCWVESIEFAGDKLTSGYVPATALSAVSLASPRFGHHIKAKQTWSGKFNTAGAGIVIDYAATPAPGPGPKELRDGRSIVLVGQDSAPTAIAPGGTAEITFTPVESGHVGRFVWADTSSNNTLDAVSCTAVYLSGKRIWKGSIPLSMLRAEATAAPWLNQVMVAGEHKLTFSLQNNDVAATIIPCGAYVVVS